MNNAPDAFSHLPIELTPVYKTASVNEAVQLYSGPVILHQDDQSWRGDGSLSLEWLPHPHLSARLAPEESGRAPKLERTEIEFVQLGVRTSAYISRTPMFLSGSGHERVEGVVPSVNTGSTGPFHRIRFHVPNFPDLTGANIRTPEGGARWARLTMNGGGWRILLDPIRMQSVMQELPIAVGYALTHVGTVEREDGCSFGFNDAKDILHCLTYFLSFCRASWVGPILCSGEDSNGAVLGTKWKVGQIDPYSRAHFWVPTKEHVYSHIQQAFQGFLARWQDQLASDAFHRGIEWYLEASSGRQPAKSLILTQAALELLSWTSSVVEDAMLSTDGWNKLPAADKIRVLLASRGIPLSIPPGFTDLDAYCKAFDIKDGPGAFVDMRNILVHADPAKRKRVQTHPDALTDAKILGLWYLDLLLLRACQYRGRYSNRLLREVYRGDEVCAVPWA